MAVIQVKNAAGETVWESQDVQDPLVEVVDDTVKVTDMDSGEVVATHELKPGERVAR